MQFLASYPDLNDGDVVGVEERLEARLTVGGQVVFHADTNTFLHVRQTPSKVFYIGDSDMTSLHSCER